MVSISKRFHAANALAVAGRVAVVSMTLTLGGCAQLGDFNFSLSSLVGAGKDAPPAVAGGSGAAEGPTSELQKATTYWAKEAGKNPRDMTAQLNYARNLKAMGRKQEAFSVLQAAYLYNADKNEFLSEYGRLALDLGQVATAAPLLERADDPAKPDWRIISARGTVMAKQGQYKEAIPFFERARDMAPSQTSLLNNLAMAYAMDGQAAKAEELLRQAQDAGAADPRIKQNLALILQLQGKKAEAQQLVGEIDPDAGTAPVAPVAARSPVMNVAKGEKAVPASLTAPVTPVLSAPLDPDEVIRAALQAEANKSKPAPRKKAATVVSDADAAPSLRPSTR